MIEMKNVSFIAIAFLQNKFWEKLKFKDSQSLNIEKI